MQSNSLSHKLSSIGKKDQIKFNNYETSSTVADILSKILINAQGIILISIGLISGFFGGVIGTLSEFLISGYYLGSIGKC